METLARAANRGSVSTGGYDIEYSVKNEQDNGERFQSTNLGTPSSTKIFTFSMWVKRTEIINRHFLSYQANTGITVSLAFANDSSTQALYYFIYNSATDAYGKTTALFRDTSAWYHIVWRVDTTQATAADRIRIYVNGVQQDLESGNGSASIYPSQNYDVPLQTTHYLLGFDGSSGFCGYCSQYYYIDGQSLAPTDFGEFDSATGIWKPIEYTGTFGNAGYYLDFADASALGKDVGNSKGNFSHYGGSSADQATDTPTNNFATLNPLVAYYGSATINEGATKIQGTSTSSFETVYSTMAVTSGKWYFELVNLLGYPRNTNFGIVNLDTAVFDGTAYNSAGFWLGNMDTGGQIYYYENGVATGNEYITFSQGDIIGLAFDADNGTLDFYLNNSNQEQFTGIPSGTFAFIVEVQGTASPYIQANFGGYTTISISSAASDANGYGTFEYAPPSGYYALCSKNLAEFG
jgi:hypothetical protein